MNKPQPTPNPAPADLADMLRRASTHHQRGQLREAETLYRDIIAAQPDHFDALHLYGVLMHQRGQQAEALRLIGQALAANARSGPAHSNRGLVLAVLERHDEALASYDAAIALKPDYAEALNNRGNTLRALRRTDEALASFERALALRPGYPQALNNRGNALIELGRFAQALASYDQALALRPDYIDALINRAGALRRLDRPADALASYAGALAIDGKRVDALIGQGNLLHALGRFAEALASFERVLAIRPDYAEILNNRGNALWCLRRPAEALMSYDAALALKPDYPQAHNNRGNALLDLNRPADALASFDAALARKPDYADALVNRGNALGSLNRAAEALASFERAISIDPDLAEAHWNKGLLCLSLGDFAAGWRGYEWRHRRADAVPRDFAQPQWRGEDLRGKTILLHAEQGFGDTIQFVRYLPMVAGLGGKIILEVPDSLMPLLGAVEGVAALVSRADALPGFDLHCPLLSLPLAFGTTLTTIPAPAQYLRVPTERIEKWRARLTGAAAPRIGLVWSGKPTHMNDHNRSIALARLAPLLAVPGCQFVSLQREYREADLATLDNFPALLRLEHELADFADTAAAVAQLDLVIAVDSAVAHLAGAMGKPVWILLPRVPDWRWMLDREDTPWYPSARLFRQPAIDDWDSAIARLAGELAGIAKTGRAASR